MRVTPHAMVDLDVAALVITEPLMVAQPGMDLDRLPFSDGERDVNGDTPFVSAAITPRPLQDLTVELAPGVHLHWSLPAALRRGEHDDAGVTYPAIPDRWLVRRQREGEPERAWVVESDYLHPPDGRARPDHIAFPVPPDHDRGHHQPFRHQSFRHQPFRHLGRRVAAQDWRPTDPAAERLDHLTAIGYGDPTFAALYPSCRGVLGTHDDELATIDTRYTVVGWYADPEQDLLGHARRRAAEELGRPATADELAAHLHEQLGITLDREPGDPVPDRSLLVGSVLVWPGEAAMPHVPRAPWAIVGPTGAEAVARVLAEEISGAHAWDAHQVEERLDQLLLGSGVDPSHVDHGHRFAAACHARSFEAVPGGSRWLLAPTDDAPARADATVEAAAAPAAAAPALDRLEQLQRRRDRLAEQRHTAAAQTFADWQRWMVCRHGSPDAALPDPDRVMDLLRNRDLPLLEALDESLATLDVELAEARASVEALLTGTGLALRAAPDTPYHLPAEPYVLLRGDALDVRDRDGRPAPVLATVTDDLTRLRADLDANPRAVGMPVPTSTDYPPWRPVLMDWEVEVFAVQDPQERPPGLDVSLVADYPADHLTRHYHDDPDDVDVRLDQAAPTSPVADVVAGRALLTRGATRHAAEALDRAVWTRLIHDGWFDPDQPPPDEERAAVLDAQAATIVAHYETADPDGVVVTALRARAALGDARVMGQVLSGFHAGLLTQRQMSQLPIEDPLGFREHRELTARVRAAVGREGLLTPLGEAAFHPLRALDLSLLRIRIIDRFGRHRTLDRDGDGAMIVVPTRQLERNERHPARLHLPARIAHPTKVEASWLAAADDLEEAGDHPRRSPVCGWIVADHLDRGLLVHAADGALAGRIATAPDPLDPRRARWFPAPGPTGIAHPAELPNRHLADAVDRLRALGPEGLDDVVGQIDVACEAIEPDGAAAHPDLALLTGQPLAVVRARLDLRARAGLPLDQGWPALRRTLADPDEAPRSDRGLGGVVVRVRLGALDHRDDGLVAHWVEHDDGTVSRLHMADARVEVADDGTREVRGAHDVTLEMTIDGPAVTVTMLMDPRAVVHVTTGLLPVQRLRIPAEHRRAAQSLSFVTFAAPLLSPEGSLHVPVPHEPDRRWTWVAPRRGGWDELDEADLTVGAPPTIDRRQVLHEGWLRLDRVSPTRTEREPNGGEEAT